MSLSEFLSPLHAVRTDHQVVIPTMSAAREWMRLGTHTRDFIYAPSAMGQAPALGFGLALARPQNQVIVLNGDGCQLMNLGCLVTITSRPVPNLILVICDNGAYEVTGNQSTAAKAPNRPNSCPVDFAQIARGCGWSSVFDFPSAADWAAGLGDVLAAPGPTCVVWHIPSDPAGAVPVSPSPAATRARQFRATLASVAVASVAVD